MPARIVPLLAVTLLLASCVAPEETSVPRAAAPVATPPSSTAHYEDAPIPNRKATAPRDPGNIRIVQ